MMMMIGELRRPHHHPTVEIPDWDPYDAVPSPMTFSPSADYSPSSAAADYAAALHHRYDHLILPAESDTDSSDIGLQQYDSFACDDFRMYDFKVRRCVRGRSHDWTECPFAHPGEKARRRDPRRFHYSGTACPDFRKGCCRKGDACELAHGVFECWLHPSRYRTQPCKDGVHCTRRVCFFAHSPDQLRVLPADNDPSSPYESPPASPSYNVPGGRFESVSELVGALKGLHVGGGGVGSPARCWGYQQRTGGGDGFGSPRTGFGITPNRSGTSGSLFDTWSPQPFEEEPVAEKPVESGRDIRAMMYARLRKNNSLDRADSPCPVPDLGWVSELVK